MVRKKVVFVNEWMLLMLPLQGARCFDGFKEVLVFLLKNRPHYEKKMNANV